MKLPDINYAAFSAVYPEIRGASNKPPSLHSVMKILGIITALVVGGSILTGSTLLFNLLPVILIALTFVGVIWSLYRLTQYDKLQNAILTAFARDNNATYMRHVPEPAYPGLIFQVGDNRKIDTSIVIPTDKHPVEIGNYRYTTGSGKNKQANHRGYMRLKLPRKLPHMVLDAKSNNFVGMFTNLPTSFDKDQVLSLEGDFNNHFTLYAPKQYERDALYVFTPDVMLALVDHAAKFDVEVVDDELYLYSMQSFDFAKVQTIQELLRLASILSPEFTQQTDRYADDRAASFAANHVAVPGQRLKKRSAWALTAVFVGYYAFTLLNDLIGVHNPTAGMIVYIMVGVLVWGFVIYLFIRWLRRMR